MPCWYLNACVMTFSYAWVRKLSQTSWCRKDTYILIAEHEITTLFSQLVVFRQTKNLLHFSFFFSFFFFFLNATLLGINLSVLLCVLCTNMIQGRWNILDWLTSGQGWLRISLIAWAVLFLKWEKGDLPKEVVLGICPWLLKFTEV